MAIMLGWPYEITNYTLYLIYLRPLLNSVEKCKKKNVWKTSPAESNALVYLDNTVQQTNIGQDENIQFNNNALVWAPKERILGNTFLKACMHYGHTDNAL